MRKLALLALLSGCATVPLARPGLDQRAKALAPTASTAILYFYRPTSPVGGAVRVGVYVDEARVGVLAPGTFAAFALRPGEHKVGARAATGTDRTLVAEAGRTYFLKAAPSISWSGGAPGASLDPVDSEPTARSELESCSLVADWAAESIHRAASDIAKVNVYAAGEAALLAAGVRAVDTMAGPGFAAPSADIEEAVLRARSSLPGQTDQQLVQVGARAMLQSLTPTPAPPTTPGRYEAVTERWCGLVLRRGLSVLLIAGTLPGSPAALAGLDPGLELREVNGQPVHALTPSFVAGAIAGPAGTEVTLSVGRPGEPSRSVVLRRAVVDRSNVECRLLGDRVLYLRPHGLVAGTSRRVRDFGRATEAPGRSVILDLRGNGGGSLTDGQDLADTFLAAGNIMSTTGARAPVRDQALAAQPGTSSLEQGPLVVLTDRATSGTAEAVAAALQDQRRASVRGVGTAGQGVISTVVAFGGAQMPVPIAYLLRASGQPLEGVGVVPDVLDDGLAPGPDGAPAVTACPGETSPGALDDPLVMRAAEGLLAPYQGAGR